ncbi:MAG: LysM peptidoglycan-binding domain-containing protein [Phycisphaerae bacterium]
MRIFSAALLSLTLVLFLTAAGCQNRPSVSADAETDDSLAGTKDPDMADAQGGPMVGEVEPFPETGPDDEYVMPPTEIDPDVANSDMPPTEITPDVVENADQANPRTHIVKLGDTLYKLAKQYYGAGTAWQTIAAANPGVDPKKLRVGQRLIIPPAPTD